MARKFDKSVHVTDLPEDRLATMDETGKRLYLHPAEVLGKFRQWRTAVYSVLLVVFLVLPWIKIGGHQAVLLDLPNRKFAIFGLTFWAHDAPMLLFVLGTFVLGLLLVTAIWGRVWCGWACPQTVFIDMVYRRIETWFEGNFIKRRKLMEAPWSVEKVTRKGLKWVAFLFVSLIIAHSFLAYFVGVEELARMVRSSPLESPGAFGVMAFVAGLVLFDFGWFREQFCIVACPYGRLQSVLMDERSLTVAYDEGRGEPRKQPGLPPSEAGDCVSCFKCVQVCPTGIDIRKGLQMECIGCTACIDACDDVMDRVDKPRGLIRYASMDEIQTGEKSRRSFRSLAYLVLLLSVIGGLVFTISQREPLNVSVIRPPDAPYRVLDTGEVVNRFRMHVANTGFDDMLVDFRIDPATLNYPIATARRPVPVAGGASETIDIFVRFPKDALENGKKSVQLTVVTVESEEGTQPLQKVQQVDLLGPVR